MFKETNAWRNVKKPVLMLTGTDDSMFADNYENRVKAFDYLPSGYKRLVVINGADHTDFGGRGRHDEAQQTTVKAIFDFLNMLKENSWQPVQYPNAVTKDK